MGDIIILSYTYNDSGHYGEGYIQSQALVSIETISSSLMRVCDTVCVRVSLLIALCVVVLLQVN